MPNSISDVEDIIRDIQKAVDNIAASLNSTTNNIIKDTEKAVNKEVEKREGSAKKRADTLVQSSTKRAQIDKDTAEEVGEISQKSAKKSAGIIKTAVNEAFNGFIRLADSSFNSITSKYKSYLQEYTQQQQKLAFNLLGSGISYDAIRDSLSALSTNSYIKQREVYQNLTNLVSSGITMNASQRAFLQTATEQVGLAFDSTSDSLNRLIQLQEIDLSEARVAQMAGLKTFLEQNYQNSQYIKQGFSQVSDALFEMQSLMSAQMAMSTEKTIQTYLGSFRSAGGASNSVSSIAQALGAIGSGDFSSLSDGMQNLMIMAASRAGLSYADLLLNGLDDTKSEQLMTRLLSYVSSMSNMGGGSNVAMNAVAKMFGVTVSDIRAAQQMNVQSINVRNVNDDIASFLYNLANSTNQSTRAYTLFDNLVSNRALYGDLLRYQTEEALFGTLGPMLGDIPIFGDALNTLISNRPGLGVMTGVLSDAGGITGLMSGIGTILKDTLSTGWDALISALNPFDKNEVGLSDVLKRAPNATHTLVDNIIKQMITNVSGDYKNLWSDYYSFDTGNGLYTTSGSLADYTSSGSKTGATTSAKVSSARQPQSTMNITSVNEPTERSTGDILEMLSDSSSTPYSTISTIVEANNAVLIGSQEITNNIVNYLEVTSTTIQSIYVLLEAWAENSGRYNDEITRVRNVMSSLSDNSALLYGDWSGMRTGR